MGDEELKIVRASFYINDRDGEHYFCDQRFDLTIDNQSNCEKVIQKLTDGVAEKGSLLVWHKPGSTREGMTILNLACITNLTITDIEVLTNKAPAK